MRGGWNSTGKTEADSVKKISVRFLNERGFFSGWQSGTMTWTSGRSGTKSSVSIEVSTMNEEKYLRIYYTQTNRDTDEEKDFDYKIPLLSTPCRYGGKRYWFQCPWYKNGQYCGRRVGTLYKNGDYFACRHCYNLTYASRNASARYKGFVSCPDLDEQEAKVKRMYYAGKPTRKYRKLLKMERRFEMGVIRAAGGLGILGKKYGV
ncbi:MAG: hypothetical protein ABSB00_00165 [Minisyncoccia bacterium]|jgi:hypothetical protein